MARNPGLEVSTLRRIVFRFLGLVVLTILVVVDPIGSGNSNVARGAAGPRIAQLPTQRPEMYAVGLGFQRFSGTHHVLYDFQGGTDGTGPQGKLIADMGGALYGTTSEGGGTGCGGLGCGTVFKLTPSGSGYTESILYAFNGGTDGQAPMAGLLADTNGVLYGTTSSGGSAGAGTIYELKPSGSTYTESVIYNFGSYSGDGADPGFGALVTDSSGALYGTTRAGGSAACTYGCGTVFKLAPQGSSWTESVIYAFQYGSDSAYPAAGLLKEGNTFFGTTEGVCCPSGAVVFSLTAIRTGYRFRTLYTFRGVPDGDQPVGGVVTDGSGALYGTTAYGGNSAPRCGTDLGCGTVFKLSPSGSNYTESILYRFKYNPTGPGLWDGAFPDSGVVVDSTGAVYGTTNQGGSNMGHCGDGGFSGSCGTIFKLTPSGSSYIETRFAFDGVNGRSPFGSLLRVNNSLFGTTEGATFAFGTVFRESF